MTAVVDQGKQGLRAPGGWCSKAAPVQLPNLLAVHSRGMVLVDPEKTLFVQDLHRVMPPCAFLHHMHLTGRGT